MTDNNNPAKGAGASFGSGFFGCLGVVAAVVFLGFALVTCAALNNATSRMDTLQDTAAPENPWGWEQVTTQSGDTAWRGTASNGTARLVVNCPTYASAPIFAVAETNAATDATVGSEAPWEFRSQSGSRKIKLKHLGQGQWASQGGVAPNAARAGLQAITAPTGVSLTSPAGAAHLFPPLGADLLAALESKCARQRNEAPTK